MPISSRSLLPRRSAQANVKLGAPGGALQLFLDGAEHTMSSGMRCTHLQEAAVAAREAGDSVTLHTIGDGIVAEWVRVP